MNTDVAGGTLEETITVTGETPVVDVQSVGRQRRAGRGDVDTPARQPDAGVRGGADARGHHDRRQRCGRRRQRRGAARPAPALTVHGSRNTDLQDDVERAVADEFPHRIFSAGRGQHSQYQEIAIDFAAGDAEQPLGGVRMNLIPAEGGNVIHGTVLHGIHDRFAMQGSNYIGGAGGAWSGTPNKLKRIWDVNPTLGGPIKQDKLWFFVTGRHTGSWKFAPTFANRNAGNASAWTYDPDTTGPQAISEVNAWSGIGRVTWQATPRHKFNVGYEGNEVCTCDRRVPSWPPSRPTTPASV